MPGGRGSWNVHFPQVADPGHLGLYPVSTQRKEVTSMTDAEVRRYIDAVHLKTHILLRSGIGWKPEYDQMLEEANKELVELRPLVDEELRRREHDR